MTNKEYITKSLSGLNVTDDDIDIIIMKGGIDGDAQANVEYVHACDMAIYNRLSLVVKGMTQNVTEGGYSLSWNMDAVKMYYNALCNELGVANVMSESPKIRNRSNLW